MNITYQYRWGLQTCTMQCVSWLSGFQLNSGEDTQFTMTRNVLDTAETNCTDQNYTIFFSVIGELEAD